MTTCAVWLLVAVAALVLRVGWLAADRRRGERIVSELVRSSGSEVEAASTHQARGWPPARRHDLWMDRGVCDP